MNVKTYSNSTLCNLNLRSATNSIFECRRNSTFCNLNAFNASYTTSTMYTIVIAHYVNKRKEAKHIL